MAVIDAHVHMGPTLANPTTKPMLPAETTDQLIALLDQAGIDRACTFAPTFEGGEVEDPNYGVSNRAVYEAWKRYPDRIVGFCRVGPNMGPTSLDEMKRCREEYGFVGLKLHADGDCAYINGPSSRLMVERAAEYGWTVLMHTGFYPLSHPTLVMPLARTYPNINFLLAHLGYRHLSGAIAVAQRYANVYLETSANSTAQMIREVLEKVGPARLVYGSDLPYTQPAEVQRKIRLQPSLPAADQALILGGTMERLLGLAKG